MIVFRDFWILFLSPLIIVFVVLLSKKPASASFRFSSSQLIKGLNPTFKIRLRGFLKYLRALALLFFIIALARPQSPVKGSVSDLKGIDIVLAIDSSASMLAEDFNVEGKRINRLDVTKMVVKDFISGREGDKIGVVSFATQAYTTSPLTVDYKWGMQAIDRLNVDISEDSTSIGYGIANSLNRLKDSKAKTKIIILLTDGRNNAGDISPQTAAEIAHSLNVKIYTIGVGTKGVVPYPFTDKFGAIKYRNIQIDLDEDTLKNIALKTKGEYFRATDTESLKNVYKEISNLEKTETKAKKFREYEELFGKFLLWGLCLLFLEILLENTILRKIP